MYRIALIASQYLTAHAEHLRELLSALDRPDVALYCDHNFQAELAEEFHLTPRFAGALPSDMSPLDVDFVLSLGGMGRSSELHGGSSQVRSPSLGSIWGDLASLQIWVSRKPCLSCLVSSVANIPQSDGCSSR